MNLVESLIQKLQRHPKRFVFSDGNDARVLQAARQIVSREMGVPMLVGDRSAIKRKAAKLDLNTAGMRIIEPERSADLDPFAQELSQLPRYANKSHSELRAQVLDTNTYATLMLKRNQAEVIVAGATARASSALRPLFQIIGTQEGFKAASSLMILELEAKPVGIEGALFMADCGVIPDPTAEQLADIAITTATLAHHLTDHRPKVAMLSFTTHGNSRHPSVLKVKEATELARDKARQLNFGIEIEGDIQVDAALDRATAIVKGLQESSVAGQANVLIFPDLNSGNIASKLVQLLTGANTYGQIITGLKRPAVEISRGASAHDILGAAAIAGCQAVDHTLLFARG